uniref:Uncharacterized protein n=1 Tax=Anguilla anguilla TaxID=7936 RepID=A0A0E9PAY7_ANGAN
MEKPGSQPRLCEAGLGWEENEPGIWPKDRIGKRRQGARQHSGM